jgi:cellobiose dehydrogenase (acceptor)
MDGHLYQQEGFNVLAAGFNKSGWSYVIPNDSPSMKNHTYGHTTYMFSNGERGGPMATYLDTALSRPRYVTLWMNTAVKRLIREGGHITGVEVECIGDGGQSGNVSVTSYTGRVILSAGVFGTSKILFRSK